MSHGSAINMFVVCRGKSSTTLRTRVKDSANNIAQIDYPLDQVSRAPLLKCLSLLGTAAAYYYLLLLFKKLQA